MYKAPRKNLNAVVIGVPETFSRKDCLDCLLKDEMHKRAVFCRRKLCFPVWSDLQAMFAEESIFAGEELFCSRCVDF